MRVAVVGTGYVGLVTGACFSDLGIHVTCVDQDAVKVQGLLDGRMPIFEPGLEAIVHRNHSQGRLAFSTDLEEAIRNSLVLVIAVGTPPRKDGTADLGYVEAVARTIGRSIDGYKVIVTKSTVPAGTGARVREIVDEESDGRFAFDVCSNPEFLREGSAIEDFMSPDRIVVGVESEQAQAILADLYRPLTSRGFPLLFTNVETAEVIKYASNAFLATKVSFINEVSALCEAVGADVKRVAEGMGSDRRIGPQFLRPGPGYGGSCFPKDTQAFAALGQALGAPLGIVEATIQANEAQQLRCLEKARELLGSERSGLKVGALGLAFKPDTDDMRDSPAIPILRGLVEDGVEVHAFDPEAMENARHLLPGVQLSQDPLTAARDADLLLILTEWNQFRALEWDEYRAVLAAPRVLDLRNLYDPAEMRTRGIEYRCIGRPAGDIGPALEHVPVAG